MDASVEGGSPRRSSSSSPEFEFLAVSGPSQELLTADELFADGVVLPLHLLSLRHPYPEPEAPPGAEPEPGPAPDPSPPPLPPPAPPAADLAASISCSPASGSKRWKDIFKVGEKKPPEEKERRKERKGGSTGSSGAAELNINIWPFSRSRSAGNASAGGARPRASISGRKVSSAPCSRSNSRGDSSKQQMARRWAASPGRPGGVPVGRTSPVWQIRRPEHRDMDKVTGGKRGSGVRVLNMNVNACIGYRGQGGSCRADDKDGATGRARTAGEGGGSLFGLRALFSKKVY